MKPYRFYEQFLVNRERRFIYCFVPKVACSSLKQWFARVAGIPPENAEPNVHVFVDERFSLARLPNSEADELLRNESYYRFAFIRNPFARLVSAYVNKIVVPQGPGLGPIKRVQRGPLWDVPRRVRFELRRLTTGVDADFQQGITFREFVHHVATWSSPQRLDSHWRPQSLILGDVHFDFVGLLENMRADFEQVCRQLGVESDLPRSNISRRDTFVVPSECCADWPTSRLRELESYPPFYCFYTPELTETVKRLYREDWERFTELSALRRRRGAAEHRPTKAA